MSMLKKAADLIEEYPNTTSTILGVIAVGIYAVCMKVITNAVAEDFKPTTSLTFTPKQ